MKSCPFADRIRLGKKYIENYLNQRTHDKLGHS